MLRTRILGPKSTQPLRDIIYRVQNKGAGHCTGNDLLCLLHGDRDEKIPSLYLRALAERTLNRFDIERRIALSFVSLVRVPGEAPQKSIESALGALENMYTHEAYEFKKPFETLTSFEKLVAAINDQRLTPHLFKKREHIAQAEDIVYAILHGNPSTEQRRDYTVRQTEYATRAIRKNKNWLLKMLTH